MLHNKMTDGWIVLGPVEPSTRISMLVYLNVDERAILNLWLSVFDPSNTKFRKYPSVRKLRNLSRYDDPRSVLDLLRNHGEARPNPVMPDRIHWIATPKQISGLFGVYLNYAYLAPYSPDRVKIVPDGDYREKMSPWLREQVVAIPFLEVQALEYEYGSSGPKKQDVSDISIWSVEELRARYVLPRYTVHNPMSIGSWQPNWTGVGSFDLGNLDTVVSNPSDYSRKYISQKEVCVDYGYNEESSFSLQIMVGMAPKTHVTIYQDWGEIVGSRRMDKQSSLFDYLYEKADDSHTPRLWCFTWLQKESAIRPEHARRINFELMRLNLLGYTFISASGDWANGFVDEWDPNTGRSAKNIPLIPACFPTVLSVGASQVLHSTGQESPARIPGKWVSGYGESTVFRADVYCPWQTSGVGRRYPDVLVLGQLFQLKHDGKIGLRYGTSLSAPVMTSFISQTHMRPLGFINRALHLTTASRGMYLQPDYLVWLRHTTFPPRTFSNFGIKTLVAYILAGLAVVVIVLGLRQLAH